MRNSPEEPHRNGIYQLWIEKCENAKKRNRHNKKNIIIALPSNMRAVDSSVCFNGKWHGFLFGQKLHTESNQNEMERKLYFQTHSDGLIGQSLTQYIFGKLYFQHLGVQCSVFTRLRLMRESNLWLASLQLKILPTLLMNHKLMCLSFELNNIISVEMVIIQLGIHFEKFSFQFDHFISFHTICLELSYALASDKSWWIHSKYKCMTFKHIYVMTFSFGNLIWVRSLSITPFVSEL